MGKLIAWGMNKLVWIPQIIIIILMLIALQPHAPHQYYTTMRWLSCAAFVYIAIRSGLMNKYGWVCAFGILTLLYNPIQSLHLTRSIWSIINLSTIIVSITSIFALRKSRDSKDQEDVAREAITHPAAPSPLVITDHKTPIPLIIWGIFIGILPLGQFLTSLNQFIEMLPSYNPPIVLTAFQWWFLHLSQIIYESIIVFAVIAVFSYHFRSYRLSRPSG